MRSENMIVTLFLKRLNTKRVLTDINPKEAVALDDKIIEVEQYLISTYGTPVTKDVEGKKYRFINENLDKFLTSFGSFIAMIEGCGLDTSAYTDELFLILDYCKLDDKLNFPGFVKKLEQCENKAKVVEQILAEISNMVEQDLGAIKVEQCFKNVLKIKNNYYDCIGFKPYNYHKDRIEKLENLIAIQERY